MNSELHPLEPFLPANARVLMLGSFPPKRIRWSMDFFYPNLQNDMWRIVGYLATGDKSHFLMPGGRKFDQGTHRGLLPLPRNRTLRHGGRSHPAERQCVG